MLRSILKTHVAETLLKKLQSESDELGVFYIAGYRILFRYRQQWGCR